MHPSRRKELEKLAFGQCLLAGLRGGQVFEDAMTTIPQETLKTLFRINSCSPCTRCRQGKRGDRPRASRHACKLAYEACNRSTTTHKRSTTGQRFSSSLLFQILSQRARRRLRLIKQEDPHMLPNIPNYQCDALKDYHFDVTLLRRESIWLVSEVTHPKKPDVCRMFIGRNRESAV